MDTIPNTMDSILEGIKSGADIVEIDVRATKDNILVLSHDSLIDEPYKELIKIDKTKNFCELSQVLDLAKKENILFNLDIKDFKTVEVVIGLLKKTNSEDYVILSGIDEDKARILKNYNNKIRYLYNVDEKLFENCDSETYKKNVRQIFKEATSLSCAGININEKYCNEELVYYSQIRFLPVSIWTVDDIRKMRKFIKMGVYSITTNEVRTLKKLL